MLAHISYSYFEN